MKRVVLGLIAALTLPACATITTGTSHSLSVITDPPGASCALRRGGDVIGVVNPTPGTVRVDKSHRNIEIECARAGNLRGTGVAASGFQPMFLGNILIGGVIGMGVDIISAAGTTYPNTVHVALRPADGAPGPADVQPSPQSPGSGTPLASRSEPPPGRAQHREPAGQTLEQFVAAEVAECRRQRRNCESAAENAARAFEDARQARISRGIRS